VGLQVAAAAAATAAAVAAHLMRGTVSPPTSQVCMLLISCIDTCVWSPSVWCSSSSNSHTNEHGTPCPPFRCSAALLGRSTHMHAQRQPMLGCFNPGMHPAPTGPPWTCLVARVSNLDISPVQCQQHTVSADPDGPHLPTPLSTRTCDVDLGVSAVRQHSPPPPPHTRTCLVVTM
jgi:hypothetical protein